MKEFKRGTPAFGLCLGLLLAGCGALIMWIGFWRTLVLALLFAAGYFLGAIRDKAGFVRDAVDKVVPGKQEESIDFRREVKKNQGSDYAADGAAKADELIDFRQEVKKEQESLFARKPAENEGPAGSGDEA